MLYIRYFIFYIELKYFNILYRKYIFTYYVRSMCLSIFKLSIEIRSLMIGSMSPSFPNVILDRTISKKTNIRNL